MNFNKCCFPFECCSRPIGVFRRYSSRKKSRIVLMLVGLDNAGKSCTAKRLAREPVESVVPTVGFSSVKLRHRGYSVIIYDLGGSPQIRGIWPRYYVDVHGVIYVVDASDLSRIDESRKVLEELLSHEKLAGKPLLILANKQDREGALDEIDIVERLNVEKLVNQQKCPTLVETCSAAGPPGGSNPQLDPGILNGYRWLLRRIISEYDKLNARVVHDSEEERVVAEAARKEWLRRQDTELQAESLPLDPDPSDQQNPFKPIDMLVVRVKKDQVENTNGDFLHRKSTCRGPQGDGLSLSTDQEPFKPVDMLIVRVKKDQVDQNGHLEGIKENKANGHVVPLDPHSSSVSQDSPDDSSHTLEGEYIPLHSPTSPKTASPIPSPPVMEPDVLVVSEPLEPGVLVISEPQPIDVVLAVREQFEWKMREQKRKKKKRMILKRSNRTAPTSASSAPDTKQEERRKELPPLRGAQSCPWARPASAKSLPVSKGWGLTESLEEVDPPTPRLAPNARLPPTACLPLSSRLPLTSQRSSDNIKLEVLTPPRTLDSTQSDSDSDDVVVCFPRPTQS